MIDFQPITQKISNINLKSYKHRHIIYALIILVLLIPILIVSFYNIPSVDDFSYSSRVSDALSAGAGFFEVIKTAWETSMYYMETWQGLYTSAFVLSLQPAVFGLQYAWVGPVLMMVCIFAGVTTFIKATIYAFDTESEKHKKEIFIIIILVFFFIIQCMPSVTEGIFWFNGAANYTLPWAIAAVNISLVSTAIKQDKIDFKLFAVIVLSAVLSGGNHVSTFMNILLCGFAVVVSFFTTRKKGMIVSLSALISSCIGFYIVMSAPGTAVRRSMMGKQSVFVTVGAAAYKFFLMFEEYFTLTFALLLIVLTPEIVKIGKNLPKIKLTHLIAAVLIFGVVICGMLSVPFFVMASFGSPRTQNLYYFTWVLGMIIIYSILIIMWLQNMNWKVMPDYVTEFLKNLSVVACMVLIVFTAFVANLEKLEFGTSTRAVMELIKGEPQGLRTEFIEREKLAEAGQKELELFKHTDTMIFFGDITEEIGYYANTAFATYYDLEYVIAIDD